MRLRLLAVSLLAVALAAGCGSDPAEDVTAVSGVLVAHVDRGELGPGQRICTRFAYDDNVEFSSPARTAARGPIADSATGSQQREIVRGLTAEHPYWFKVEQQYLAAGAACSASGPWYATGTTRTFVTDKPLRWRPPTLSSPVTVAIAPQGGNYWHLPNVDCLLVMPKVPVTGTIHNEGCNNVQVIGGEVKIDARSTAGVEHRGLQVTGFNGTAHIEGVRFRGAGMNNPLVVSSAAPGSIGQLENIRIDEIHGNFAEPAANCATIGGGPLPHPDAFQTWQGPHELRFDRWSAISSYAGFQMGHRDAGTNQLEVLRMRDVEVQLEPGACFAFGAFNAATGDPPATIEMENVNVNVGNRGFRYAAMYPSQDTGWWAGVRQVASISNLSPAGKAGLTYLSPGYE